MCAQNLKLAKFLSEQNTLKAYSILQLSRIVKLSVPMDDFFSQANHFLASDKKDWINDCLLELPR